MYRNIFIYFDFDLYALYFHELAKFYNALKNKDIPKYLLKMINIKTK
jgi:hypothetical protein